jgi:predicted transcriptional regulator
LADEQQSAKAPLAAKPLPIAKATPLKRLFLKPKPCAMLLILKDAEQSWYPSKIARASGASYVHVVNLLASLRKFSIVSSEKKGKQNIFKLTERGAYLALTLDDLVKKCESAEAEQKTAPKQEALPPHAAAEPEPAKPDAKERHDSKQDLARK